MHNCTTPQTSETDDEPSPKKGKKRGVKRKRPPNQAMTNAKSAALDLDNRQQMAPPQPQQIQIIPITSQGQGHSQGQGQQEKRALEARVMEISPFESAPTFKCVFCPKRSQRRERMERHVAQEHPGRMGEEQQPGYRQMSRDQGC